MDGVWHCADQMLQELCSNHLAGLGMEFDKSELGSSVNGHKQIELALGCLHLGNVDVEVTDWIALELLLDRLVAFNLWQPRDAMTRQTSMQRRARQMRGARLQCIEAIVQRQQGMPAKGDDRRLIFNGQNGGARLPRPCWQIGDRGSLLPLRHRLLTDPVALG